jgi:VWFA-related protein
MQPDRLTDYEAMRVHVYRDTMIIRQVQRRYRTRGVATLSQQAQTNALTRVVNPALDPYILAKAARIYPALAARNELTLEAMERALNSLVRRQGRKSLILVSEGFIHDTKLEGLKRTVTASLRANTAIYFLNSRGMRAVMRADEDQDLGPMESNVFRQEFETAGGSVTLAQDTGGFIMRDTDDLALGLRRIADETRAYYLIGYNPTNVERDGEFREIEIKIPGRRGIEVRARRGYYAPSGEAVARAVEPAEDAALQEAMDSPYAVGDIGLRMTHFVGEEASAGTAHVSVAAEVDIEDLGFEMQEGEHVAALRFVMVAMNRTSDEHFRYDQKVDLELLPEMRSELARTWLPIVKEFELGTGSYRAKIVLEDTATGRLGSVIHDFKVPVIDPSHFRVSTPVLSDMRVPPEEGQPGERVAIMARREFAPAAALYCRFEVYGAARLESSGMPRVSMSYEVRRSDGVLYTRGARSLIEPTADGAVSRMIGFPLHAATPDDYEIVMRVKDELTRQTLDLRETFSVSAPTRPASGREKVLPGSQ